MSTPVNVLNLMLPPAQMGRRVVAVLLDLILVFFLSLLIIGKILIPLHYAEGFMQFRLLLDAYMTQLASGQFSELLKQMNEQQIIVDMFASIDRSLFLITWAYFSLSALFLKGNTLGKQILNLRVLKLPNFKTPTFLDSTLRAGAFSFFLFTAWPFFMCFNLFCVCINALHRGIHDWFCQTYVVNYDVLEQIKDKIQEQMQKNQLSKR